MAYGNAMATSFHTADRQTYRRILALGALFCAVFVALSFSLRAQTAETRVVAKADRPMRTAGGGPELAN
jgi:hypothetical protein